MQCPTSPRSNASSFALPAPPLISCVFLLLVYFLWTLKFMAVEPSLPGRLMPPTGSAAAPPTGRQSDVDLEPVVVLLRHEQNMVAWALNDAPLTSLAQLQQSLEKIARINPDIPLRIDPAKDVPLGEVIKAFDIARLSGLTRIQFAVSE